MFISENFAWLAVVFTILLAMKYIVRISSNRKLNLLFSKSHKCFGILMLITSFLHGILASNEKKTNLYDIQWMSLFFNHNLGTACFFLALFLLFTYMFRKKIKKRWMLLHRLLTLILLILIILHVHGEIERQHQSMKLNFPVIIE